MTRKLNSVGTLNPYPLRGDEIEAGDLVGVKIILAAYAFPFFSVYMGLTDWTDDYTADYGDKLTPETCRLLFPAVFQGMKQVGWVYRD